MHRKRGLLFIFVVFCGLAAAVETARYLSFAAARPALQAFDRTEDEAAWDAWVQQQDQEVRARIDRGVEDSISNLILFGTSFTRLPRLDAPEAALTDAGSLKEAARLRVHAAAEALARPDANERLAFARDFLKRHGVAAKDVEALMAGNLTRFAQEQRGYQEKLQSAHKENDPSSERFVRSTLFEKRGLSVDTSLLPNYALEDTLRAMMRKGALPEQSVGTIAIIGPGLDFTDKRSGYDFYPLQSIQPFAMMEAVQRLHLAKPGRPLRVMTFDLNAAVNAHLSAAAKRAKAGGAYLVQLPLDQTGDWTPAAKQYWEHFGELIGKPAKTASAPPGVSMRAVSIEPKYTATLEPNDVNIVTQSADGVTVDLVIATNILVYYDRFQQALAMINISKMMNPGGVFLSNTILPAQHPDNLEFLGRRSVSYSGSGSYGDDVVVYRRK